MKVNVAINDFSPVLRGPEMLFKGLKEAGADGIELGVGFKSRWSAGSIRGLSEKYDLPIVALHQPLWAMVGIVFDRGFFNLAHELGAQSVTCHPLPRISFDEPRMERYFRRLAQVQQETGLEVLVENLPDQYNHPLLNKFFPPSNSATGVIGLFEMGNKFNLGLTLDIDHLQSVHPHKEEYFPVLMSKVKNIHLSSFNNESRHLPLYLGDLHAKEFVHHLKKINYQGIVTLEIGYPSITLRSYNFEAIRKSIELVKTA